MGKLNDIFRKMKDELATNPNSDVVFEAGQLVEYVLGNKRLLLGADFEVSQEQEQTLLSLCKKRREGYPLQYILGKWRFFDMELNVGPGVLIPRQDTEDVCLAAFEYLEKITFPVVLDLCAGSGAIGLAIKKHFPDATVVAVEKYLQAYEYLEKNIADTGLCILPVLEDVFKYDLAVEEETFDVIISNPPYIDPQLEGKLQKEVSFEPSQALYAADEGLKFYNFIAKYYRQALKEDGYIIFEHGWDQADKVKRILEKEEYKIVKQIFDTAENPRGIIGQKQ